MKKSKNWREIASRIYDEVHAALWAGLIVFVLWFAWIVWPQIPQAQAKVEAIRVLDIAKEHELYCDKLGLGQGTLGHSQCVLDLQAFRVLVERRLALDMQSFF